MNTVKVANSGDAAPMLGAQVVEASNQLHNALLAHKVVDYNHTRRLTTGKLAAKCLELMPDAHLSAKTRQFRALRLKSRRRKPIAASMPK